MTALEYREKYQDIIASDTVYVASNKKKALEFMKKNKNFNDNKTIWWWAIYDVEIDKDLEYNNLEFYNKNGNRIKNQPWKLDND